MIGERLESAAKKFGQRGWSFRQQFPNAVYRRAALLSSLQESGRRCFVSFQKEGIVNETAHFRRVQGSRFGVLVESGNQPQHVFSKSS